MWTWKAVRKGFPKGYHEFQPPKPIYRDVNNWPVFKKAEHDFGGVCRHLASFKWWSEWQWLLMRLYQRDEIQIDKCYIIILGVIRIADVQTKFKRTLCQKLSLAKLEKNQCNSSWYQWCFFFWWWYFRWISDRLMSIGFSSPTRRSLGFEILLICAAAWQVPDPG